MENIKNLFLQQKIEGYRTHTRRNYLKEMLIEYDGWDKLNDKEKKAINNI